MMLRIPEAIAYTFAMGAVIFFCRVFPFIFFRGGKTDGTCGNKFLQFVKITAPPIAMAVLCFNAIAAPIKESFPSALHVIPASLLTALLHLWKRNALLSIFSGTALFMLLQHLL
jgi:branched-subunit amino acid transport protein AzlD